MSVRVKQSSYLAEKRTDLFAYIAVLLFDECLCLYIEDIYFFEVNTKYISSSVLKTSEFS